MNFRGELTQLRPKLLRVALTLTRELSSAEDLVQDTFIRALKYENNYAEQGYFFAWLCFIMKNLWKSGKQKSWRTVELDELHAESIPCEPDAHHKVELKQMVEALNTLPPFMREAVIAISEGESYEAFAECSGVSVGTVKSRVCRGRAMLQLYFTGGENG